MQCMQTRRAFRANCGHRTWVGLPYLSAVPRARAPCIRSAAFQVRGALSGNVEHLGQSQQDQALQQAKTVLQPKSEHMALKALKAAFLVPLLVGVMWAQPAHAARKSRQAAAAQVVQMQTIEETKTPLQQLEATFSNLIHQVTHKTSDAAAAAAAAAAQGSSMVCSTVTKLGHKADVILAPVTGHVSGGQQQVTKLVETPEFRKVMSVAVILLVLALVLQPSSSSSSSTAKPATAGAGGDGGSSSGDSKQVAVKIAAAPAPVAVASPAAAAAAAATPVTTSISTNGTGSKVTVSVTMPTPAAAAAAPAGKQQQKAAAESASEAKELLKSIKQSADRINAAAVATQKEVSASAAAATAAVEKAKAVADQRMNSRAASPVVPEPPKVIKPSLASFNTPAAAKPAGSSSFGSSSSSSSGDRPGSPPAIPLVPDRGAATPALTVLGAGALLFDLMVPLGKLAVASVKSAAGGGTVSSGGAAATSSSSSGSSGDGSAPSTRTASKPAPPKPAPAPAAAAAPPAPSKPRQQSKLAKAAAAAAAESAATVRTVPTELPTVTLEELEAALRASGKM